MMNRALYEQDLRAAAGDAAGWLGGRRVLITGATGLIGSFLTEALLYSVADIHVFAACRRPEAAARRFGALTDHPGLHIVPYDAARPAPIEFEPDFIVHAACSAHPLAYAVDPVGILQANLCGTMALLEHLRNRPEARLLLLSSGEVYGENPDLPEGFSEDDFSGIDPMKPRSCYPEGKRAAEALCACYAAQYGVQALVARLCHVYGPTFTPENSRADAQFLRNALAGEDIVMKSEGSQMRSWCYVADAASALLHLLRHGAPGQAYNVANRHATASIRQYAQTLADLGGVSLKFDLPSDREKAGYTRVTRAVLNPSKLEALGWQPRFDLPAGLSHTLDCLRNRR